MSSEWFTNKDLCFRFAFSPMTMWRLENDSEANFPKAVMIGKSKRWRRADVEAWEMKRYGTTSAREREVA
jgi:predicted DNA-binding transcriptional regulator AlpA